MDNFIFSARIDTKGINMTIIGVLFIMLEIIATINNNKINSVYLLV